MILSKKKLFNNLDIKLISDVEYLVGGGHSVKRASDERGNGVQKIFIFTDVFNRWCHISISQELKTIEQNTI